MQLFFSDSDLEELLDTFSTFVKNSDESDNSSMSDTFPAIQMLTDGMLILFRLLTAGKTCNNIFHKFSIFHKYR